MIQYQFQYRLEKLLEAVSGVNELTIILHNNPDPDAIAAGAALKFLLEEKVGLVGDIVYQGVIGRAENVALVEYLDVSLQQLPDGEIMAPENFALIDTHPQAKNNPIPDGMIPLIVIDHHNNYENGQAKYSDVRPNIGATATMMTQYLQAADCKPPQRLATALLYGIKTDTLALSRNTTRADVNAYCYLSSLSDIDAFLSFEKAEVSPGYFQGLAAAMTGARAYENGLIITYLEELPYPDLVAEIADLMLRLAESAYIVALGVFDEQIHFSIRTKEQQIDVNQLAQTVAGQGGSAGGRETIAGGQIPLDDSDPEKLIEKINKRILDYFDISPDVEGEKLT